MQKFLTMWFIKPTTCQRIVGFIFSQHPEGAESLVEQNALGCSNSQFFMTYLAFLVESIFYRWSKLIPWQNISVRYGRGGGGSLIKGNTIKENCLTHYIITECTRNWIINQLYFNVMRSTLTFVLYQSEISPTSSQDYLTCPPFPNSAKLSTSTSLSLALNFIRGTHLKIWKRC